MLSKASDAGLRALVAREDHANKDLARLMALMPRWLAKCPQRRDEAPARLIAAGLRLRRIGDIQSLREGRERRAAPSSAPRDGWEAYLGVHVRS
jgi:hypothetical protein